MILKIHKAAHNTLLRGLREGDLLKKSHMEKARPPIFDKEGKSRQEDEAWLPGINKYFQIHDYLENEKAQTAIYNLNGKASIWWERLK